MRARIAQALADLEARVEARRRRARPLLPFRPWADRFLSSYFPCRSSLFHDWLADELSSYHARRGQRLNVLAPRGAAKSTWSTFAYPLWCALHNLEPYIVLTADTGDQAHKYLDSIRAELEANEALAAEYPQLTGPGPIWRQDRLKLHNGVMIEAMGTGTKMRGRKNRRHRPSLILVDDPQNTEHVTSPIQRERTWDWLVRDVCNAGSPDTNILCLGTAIHREAIVCRLQTTPGWRSHVWQAIIEWPARMDLWREWEAILHDHEDADREAKARAFYEARRGEMDA